MLQRFLFGCLSFVLLLTSFIFIPGNKASAATDEIFYEAEHGSVGNGATVTAKTNASGAKAVSSMHAANAYNQISGVNGGTSGGVHELTIRYATGDAQAVKALYVNGVKVADLTFKSTGGWNTFVNQTVKVTLNAGTSNTIKVQEAGGGTFTFGVELDKYTVVKSKFHIAGYIHPKSFKQNDLDTAAFDHITDVITIGFHTLDANGNIVTRTDDPDLANWPQYFQTLNQTIGTRKVKKWVTLNAQNPTMSQVVSNSTTRANYINSVLNFLNQNGYDGVDIDWEYPANATDWANFSTTIVEMQQVLGRNGKSISLALAPWGVNLSANAIASIEQVNAMIYDMGYYHATFEQAVSASNYFSNLGIPNSKLNLGLAWYGRPTDKSAYWIDYDEANASTSITNETDILYNYPVTDNNGTMLTKTIYFNGLDMNRRKMLLALDRDVRGVMMWHLFADVAVSQQKSLLSAIVTEKNGFQAYRNRPNLALNQWYSASTQDGTAYDVYKIFDGNDTSTYWQAPAGVTSGAFLQLDFKQATTLNTVVLKEHGNNIRSFKIQNWSNGQWVDVYTGGLMGAYKVCTFNPITTGNIRVLITSASLPNIPSTESSFTQYNKMGIYEFEVYNQ